MLLSIIFYAFSSGHHAIFYKDKLNFKYKNNGGNHNYLLNIFL